MQPKKPHTSHSIPAITCLQQKKHWTNIYIRDIIGKQHEIPSSQPGVLRLTTDWRCTMRLFLFSLGLLFLPLFTTRLPAQAVNGEGVFFSDPLYKTLLGDRLVLFDLNSDASYATADRYTPPDIRWESYFNHVRNEDDEPTAIAVSPEGNVWVTGKIENLITGDDFMTIIYAPDGTLINTMRYNNPSHGDDIPHDIVIDRDSRTYVTGQTWVSGYRENYLLARYDQSGNRIFNVMYDGPSLNDDVPSEIAIDSTIFIGVVGTSFTGSLRSYDFCVVVWDSAGYQKCVKRYNGAGDWSDYGVSITFDIEGSFIVTGSGFQGYGPEYNITTVKYDCDCNRQWIREYDGPAGEGDYAVKVIADSEDDIVVSGYSRSGESHRDYVVLKYDPDGTPLWVSRYNGPNWREDYVTDMALDLENNIYITGRSRGSDATYDIATVKYAPDGTELWVSRFEGFWHTDDEGYAIAVDDSQNVYVTGTTFDPFEYDKDIVTLTYDVDGNLVWLRFYSGDGQGLDRPVGLAYDQTWGLFLTGTTYTGPETGLDYVTINYTP